MAKKLNRPNLGDIKSFTFDNGLSVYIRENDTAPVVNVQAWVKNGSIDEGENIGCGLSHFLEHMVFQGTKKYSNSKIMDLIHKNGGDINAYTSFACTVYYVEILSAAINTTLNILSDIVSAPLFPESAFKTEKNVILRERAMIQDSPDRLLGEKLWQTIFHNHPVRHPIIGYNDKIESVNRKMMTDFYKQRYTPERIFFVISGDVKAEAVIDELSKTVGTLKRGNMYELPIPSEPAQTTQRFHSSYFEDPIARIAVGYRIPDASNNDVPALNMLGAVLGGTKSSRLIQKLRDKKQLALDIHAFTYTSNFDGVFAVSAACKPENREKLKTAIFAEIANTAKNIEKNELERARKQTITSLYRGLRSNTGIARIIGNSVLTYGTPEYAYKYIDDISKLTTSDLMRVAKKYLLPEKSSFVELIPPEEKPTGAIQKKAIKTEDKTPLKPQMTLLEKKVKLIHFEDNTLPLVDIVIVLPGGGIFEDKSNAGITRLISTLLLTETKSFSEEKLAALLDDNAVNCNISGGNNTLSIRLNCHIDSLATSTTALSSILAEPKFSKEKFIREQKITVESLKTRNLTPQRVAEDELCRELYGKHPYAVPASGIEQSITRMTPQDLRDFYCNTCLNPEKCIIGIAGDINQTMAEEIAEKLIKTIPWNKHPETITVKKPEFPKKPKEKKTILPREQSVVMLGMPGCSNTSEDRFAMDIMQTSLNGMETRLFKSIRDNAGLAYYTGLYSSRGLHEGFIAFYAGTNPENSEKVIAMFNKEKNKLAKNGLSKKEFTTTLARLEGDIAEQKLNIAEMIFAAALSEFYGNGYMEQWELLDKYSLITLEQVNQLIKKYLSTKATITVTAGAKTN